MTQENQVSEKTVRDELYRSTFKFHIITIWIGVIVNIIWFVSDYFVSNNHFIPFLIFRSSVSIISVLILLSRKKLNLSVNACLFIFVLGVSIENAYMWSVMDLPHVQQHAIAYIVLFIGAGMLVLWDLKFSLLLLATTLISNCVFYALNSQLSPDQFLVNGGLLTLTVAVFSVFMIRTRHRLTYNEIKNRLELEHSNEIIEQKHTEVVLQKVEIQHQKDKLQQKNQEITDSINYASSIQAALLPSEQKFKTKFKDSFILFKPKDIVSGDFYWIYENKTFVFYVTGDCTGHGVPGGFMTMLGLSFLEDIIVGQKIVDPAEVLNVMRDKIISALNQSDNVNENKDGMDITICRLEKNKNELTFSSANNSLYVISEEKELKEFKGDRQPCGFHHAKKPFTSHQVLLFEGDCIYTFTDGFADQFGGPKGKKFRYKQLVQLLLKNSDLSFSEQKKILHESNVQWRGTLEQIDDILIIGVKI